MRKANYAASVREIVPLPLSGSVGWAIPSQLRWPRGLTVLDCPSLIGIIRLTSLSFERGTTMAPRRQDPKLEALRAERSVNSRPEAVLDQAFAASEFFDARDLVQVKYEMVRKARVDGVTVTSAAEAFGFSRPSFYEAATALDSGGLPALVPARPGPRRAHKLTDEIVGFVRTRRAGDPTLKSSDLAVAITARFGVRVHPRSVERALARAEEPKKGGAR